MQNVMTIDGITYGLTEVKSPTFVLKCDVEEALKGEDPIFLHPLSKTSMIFGNKYYAYRQLKPKKDDENISPAPQVHSEGTNPDVANNS